jgi:hypothetical protein
MKSFLITFKPSSESPERGWPLEDFQKLVRRYLRDGGVEDKWRFHNRSEVSAGDRVFLLLQGKKARQLLGTDLWHARRRRTKLMAARLFDLMH